jgi:hypothetical protein
MKESNLLYGIVKYDDGSPVRDALVAVEEIRVCSVNEIYEGCPVCECPLAKYTTTNMCGEFYMKIYNKSSYYKVKIYPTEINSLQISYSMSKLDKI